MQKPKPGYKLVKSLFGKYEEIPEEWNSIELSNLGNLSAGGTPSRYNLQYWVDGTIPWISSGEVRNNIIVDSNEKITKLGLEESAARLFPIGTVLIAITGQGLTRGRVALLNIESATNQSVIGIICKSIHNKFLYYYLQNDYHQLRGISQGSNQAGLNLEIMKSYKISKPDNDKEQEKIASILSNVDNLISSYDSIIQRTVKLKQGLMQQLLTKGIGHKKFKKVPWLFGKEIEIPEEWDLQNIKNSSEKLVVGFVGTCEPFYTEKKEIPMLRTTNVSEGKLDLSNLKYVTRKFHEFNKKSQVFQNDLLVSRHGESGESCLVRNLDEANCLNTVIIRSKKELFLPEFFEVAFNSNIVRKQIRRTIAGGVQGVVNTSEIAKVKIIIPLIKEQQKIISVLNSVDLKLSELETKKSYFETLKKGLMQKLLTGQIRVKI